MKILMVLTSHDSLGNTGRKTGLWLEEFAAPFYIFTDAGANVVLTSPKGGPPPVEPQSMAPTTQTPDTRRFANDLFAQQALANTQQLAAIDACQFDAVYYAGGHGALWDLAKDKYSIQLIETLFANGRPVGTICHGVGALCHTRKPDGTPLVQGKRITGFTNSEEHALGLTSIVPFLLEDELVKLGGLFERTVDGGAFAIKDGHLVTGQNPASSVTTAQELLRLLKP